MNIQKQRETLEALIDYVTNENKRDGLILLNAKDVKRLVWPDRFTFVGGNIAMIHILDKLKIDYSGSKTASGIKNSVHISNYKTTAWDQEEFENVGKTWTPIALEKREIHTNLNGVSYHFKLLFRNENAKKENGLAEPHIKDMVGSDTFKTFGEFYE